VGYLISLLALGTSSAQSLIGNRIYLDLNPIFEGSNLVTPSRSLGLQAGPALLFAHGNLLWRLNYRALWSNQNEAYREQGANTSLGLNIPVYGRNDSYYPSKSILISLSSGYSMLGGIEHWSMGGDFRSLWYFPRDMGYHRSALYFNFSPTFYFLHGTRYMGNFGLGIHFRLFNWK
jgi:hypothetical protein